jgi:hypothetical protein
MSNISLFYVYALLDPQRNHSIIPSYKERLLIFADSKLRLNTPDIDKIMLRKLYLSKLSELNGEKL